MPSGWCVKQRGGPVGTGDWTCPSFFQPPVDIQECRGNTARALDFYLFSSIKSWESNFKWNLPVFKYWRLFCFVLFLSVCRWAYMGLLPACLQSVVSRKWTSFLSPLAPLVTPPPTSPLPNPTRIILQISSLSHTFSSFLRSPLGSSGQGRRRSSRILGFLQQFCVG